MSDWKKVVREVAPVLGGALGSPFAGTAVKFLVDKFLPDENVPEEEYETRLEQAVQNASTEDLALLKKLDYDFKTKMAEIGLKTEQLHQQDRKSARDLASKRGVYPQIILSACFIVGYFYLIHLFIGLMADNPDFSMPTELGILIGVMTAAIPQILNFWFGSSRSSQQKDEHLHLKNI